MLEKIRATEVFVKKVLENDASGHDWHHIDRVRHNAMLILEEEKSADAFITEMAALLHDIPDEKLNESESAGWRKLNHFLSSLDINADDTKAIIDCIQSVSYKGGNNRPPETIEAKIVQDADRLDAIGAIGIARTFAYGGKKGRAIYDPSFSTREGMTIEEYRMGNSSSLHHFYEKLLKLKDLMNTPSGKKLAENRHEFIERFLEQFYREWNSKA